MVVGKKKSAFEALILLIGADKHKSHVLNLLLHLMHSTFPCGRVECYQARERHCPWLRHLCFRMVHQLRWNGAVEDHFKLEQVGIVGAGLVYLCDSQKGHLKEW